MEKFISVDDYINSFTDDTKTVLQEMRKRIIKTAPDAVESISYGMPGYKLKGKPLAYFAGYKTHIGFYPTPNGMESFKKELEQYATGKGTAQFKHGQPIPWDLIERIVKYRVDELTQTT